MGMLHGSQNSGGPNYSKGERGPNTSGCLNQAFDKHRQAEWLEIIQRTGQRAIACAKVGVHRDTVRKHLKTNEEFARAFEEAMQFFRESLVSEAVRRGVRGVDEPIFNRGRRAMDIHPDDEERPEEEQRLVPAKVRRYSDSLLHALLKAHLPAFADKQIVQNVQDDQGLGDLSDLTPDELEQIQEFLERVKERKEGGGSTETDVP